MTRRESCHLLSRRGQRRETPFVTDKRWTKRVPVRGRGGVGLRLDLVVVVGTKGH